MYTTKSSSFLILYTLLVIVVVKSELNRLSGQTGCLRPDLVSMESDVTDNDPAKMPESVSKTRNFDKLWIVFQKDCVKTEEKAAEYIKGLINEYDCISESNNNSHSKYIYYNGKSDQYFAFVTLGEKTSPCCIDKKNIDYDDYCIGNIDYELTFEVSSLRDLECIDETVESARWHLDYIDALYNENRYSHVDTLSAIANNNVDIYVLDTGVRSSHNEFINNVVTHGDDAWGDDEITNEHGTFLAGIAAGDRSGVAKGLPIYEYAACRNGRSCSFQDIFDGFDYVLNRLTDNPTRRGVINLSFGASYSDEQFEIYNDFLFGDLEDIYDAGGIIVAAVQNGAGTDACNDWPASAEFILSVGASYIDTVAWYSNIGECVDIYAPGSEMYSSTAFDTDGCGEVSDTAYDSKGGTSFAAPVIAGVVANMLSLNDELTFEEVRRMVQQSEDNVKLSNCRSEEGGSDCYAFSMSCEDMIAEAQFLPFEFSCEDVSNDELCDYAPCDCVEDYASGHLEYCEVCNQGTGCSQCESGYVKIDFDHGCINCQAYFGDNCLQCSDGIGCQQCVEGITRVYDETCGLYYCPDE